MLLGAASQNERNLFRNRLLLLMGTIIYPAWWGVFRIASPDAVDPVGGRLAVAAFLFGIFSLSFVSAWVARNLNRTLLLCGCVLTAHYLWLVHLNAADANYLMVTFVVAFAVASCFITRRQSIAYAVFVLVLASIVSLAHPDMPRVILMSGLMTGLLVSYVAVSSRLRVLESLLQSEQRFRTMADTAPVMIWTSDEHGACNFFNNVWLKFTGSTLAQASGNGWTKCLHPEDLNRYLEKYFSAFRARRSFEGEFRLRRADGEWRWIHGESIPIYQPNGRFEGYIGTCVDITASRQNAGIPV